MFCLLSSYSAKRARSFALDRICKRPDRSYPPLHTKLLVVESKRADASDSEYHFANAWNATKCFKRDFSDYENLLEISLDRVIPRFFPHDLAVLQEPSRVVIVEVFVITAE